MYSFGNRHVPRELLPSAYMRLPGLLVVVITYYPRLELLWLLKDIGCSTNQGRKHSRKETNKEFPIVCIMVWVY